MSEQEQELYDADVAAIEAEIASQGCVGGVQIG